MPAELLSPRRMIGLYFDGDPQEHIELLGDITTTDKEGMIQMQYSFDGQPAPEEATFWNWAEGTKQKHIIERLQRLQLDCELANLAGAKFLTNIPASRDLVTLATGGQPEKSTEPVTALLRMKLPYFDRASFDSIAKARQNEVAFEDFRSAFSQAMREINQLSSPQDAQARIDEIGRDLIRVPLERIDQRMKQLHPKVFPGAAIFVGTLASTLLLQGTPVGVETLIGGTILGGVEIFKARTTYQEQVAQLQELPSFFYWELIQPTKKRQILILVRPIKKIRRKKLCDEIIWLVQFLAYNLLKILLRKVSRRMLLAQSLA